MNLLATDQPPVTAFPAETEDRELAMRWQRGEAGALELVVERFSPRVVGLAARLLGWTTGAEDVAQDVFLALLIKRNQFRGDANLWTYLAALTVNRCRSVRRRRWLHERVLGVIPPVRGFVAPAADIRAEQDEQAVQIRAAVNALPSAAREVIVLRYFEELGISDIARVLGIKHNAAEARLSRCFAPRECRAPLAACLLRGVPNEAANARAFAVGLATSKLPGFCQRTGDPHVERAGY